MMNFNERLEIIQNQIIQSGWNYEVCNIGLTDIEYIFFRTVNSFGNINWFLFDTNIDAINKKLFHLLKSTGVSYELLENDQDNYRNSKTARTVCLRVKIKISEVLEYAIFKKIMNEPVFLTTNDILDIIKKTGLITNE